MSWLKQRMHDGFRKMYVLFFKIKNESKLLNLKFFLSRSKRTLIILLKKKIFTGKRGERIYKVFSVIFHIYTSLCINPKNIVSGIILPWKIFVLLSFHTFHVTDEKSWSTWSCVACPLLFHRVNQKLIGADSSMTWLIGDRECQIPLCKCNPRICLFMTRWETHHTWGMRCYVTNSLQSGYSLLEA